ncbi:TonB-dependent siderophore receptor [Hymenobacter lapidiphilus]|uniref:TonB-dependent receptor n=1 Tax=Hymenobacter sp. CCM 8763 TaxID=2303334 RepID=UPI000E34C4ED|nr:TonB-dependent receptor [Hymenobacter sp. CCM 8763]RFP64318.1 TonB-dependent siderophore receptor [Hymenobacter sp. CCM 8763]
MKLAFTLIGCVSATCAVAQTGTVRGRITDAAQAPQIGLVVRLENTALGTATDVDGTFFMDKIAPGQYTLIVSGVGYTAQKQNIVVQGGLTTQLQLALDKEQQVLQEVVVTERRAFETSAGGLTRTNTPIKDLPQSVQVINQSTLRQQQVYRLDEALRNAAGVSETSATGNYGFRGFTTNSQSFLTNGIKGIGNPEGVMPFLANVERIEVLRGSSAILYGEGAVGGNLNLVTKQPKKTTAVNAGLSGGSFNLFRAQADVAGSLTSDKRLYALAGVGYERGGRFTRDFEHRTVQLFSSLRWEPGVNTSWQVNATYNRDRSTQRGVPDLPQAAGQLFSVPDNFRVSAADARYEGDSYQLQSQMQHRFSDRWAANLWLGYAKSRADDISYSIRSTLDSTGSFSRGRTQQVRSAPTRTLNAFLTGQIALAGTEHRLTGGLDLAYENADYPEGLRLWRAAPLNVNAPIYAAFNPAEINDPAKVRYVSGREKFTNNTYGVYVQDQVTLSPKFKALLGLRYNHYYFRYTADELTYDLVDYQQLKETPDNTTALLPRIGLVYQPTTSNSFYVDYNTGFVPQYSNSALFGGPFDPELTRQGEIGWKGDFLNHRLVPTVAVYQIQKKNVLNFDNEAFDLTGDVLFRALGGVRSRGIETTLTGTVLPGWQLIANYSYNRTEVTDSNVPEEIGGELANTPRHLSSFWTTYEFSQPALKGLLLGSGYRYTGARYSSTRNPGDADVLTYPGYGIVDAVVGYRYRQFSLQANGNNLLGKRYVRSGLFNSYFAGTPRNFLLTLGYAL